MFVRPICSLLALTAFVQASAENIRVATLNLQNYLTMDRMVEGQWRTDYPKAECEKELIREAILANKPDILVLQEIGPEPYLKELRRDIESEGFLFEHAIHMQAEDEVRHLAVLSRIEPRSVVRHDDLEFKYFENRELVKRGMLEVEFVDSQGHSLVVFGVHLKSKWSDEGRDPGSNIKRVREAEACRNRLIERTHDRGQFYYLVAGDFNDHPRSGAMRRFYNRGEMAIGELVRSEDSRGHLWTHEYRRESSYSLVDGFIVSPSLMPQVKDQRGYVVDWPNGKRGSDHRMVFLDLEFSKK